MSEIDVSKCELVDCWFYLDHTPPKGQGDWCRAIHKGACKLNSTDCKDTPIERCLIKSLYEQLQQLKAENEELNVSNKILNQENITFKEIISNLKKDREDFIFSFLEQEFDNIISEFFGIGQYTLRFSNEKKEEFIKEKVK